METSLLTFLLNTGFAITLMVMERLWPNHPYQRDVSWTLRAALLASVGIVLTLMLGSVVEGNIEFIRLHTDIL